MSMPDGKRGPTIKANLAGVGGGVGDQLRQWWQSSAIGGYYQAQTARDQLILLSVATLLAVAVFVVLVWRPLHDWKSESQTRYENAQALLTYMRANRDRIQANVQGGDAQSLLSVVGDVAHDKTLHLSRLQPEGEGSVTVVMDDEEFDKIVGFVDILEREHQLAMRQVSIDRKSAGRASARLVIQ